MNKLKGRSWAEIWYRAKQEFAAFSERHGISSLSKLPDDVELFQLLDKEFAPSIDSPEALLSNFRTRQVSRFFAAFDDRATTTEELQNHFGTDHQKLISKADSIADGRLELFRGVDLSFGNPIDWHLEPLSGKRSPLLHWSRISEIDSAETGDKKIVWELNRHQYFATLGRAYWVTGDETYAETFAVHLGQWMDQNPPKLGINWISSLEVAFRAISWLWALHFFRDSRHLTPGLYTRALKFLYLHARHLETYLSTYSSPNTHLTGEGLGLFYIGTVLPQFRDAVRWREMGRTILIDELSQQVLADGVYFELASYYHRYTTEFYLHFLILAERNSADVSADVKAKLKSLLDHLMYITRPDGSTPFIGDDDGGKLAILDESEVDDFRPLLSTGAVLFDRADYKYVASQAAESTLWLLGPTACQAFEQLKRQPPQSTSRAFLDGGLYVMRDGWESDANYMIFDCGSHGALSCGHAHADALSFELAGYGRTLLVDPGTFTYTGSKELRDYFRSSSAHNTLTIDGESSSVPGGPFSWKTTANASVITWKSDKRFDLLIGTHDGYERLAPPVTHTRSVLFLKGDYWVIRDTVQSDGAHQYGLNFHFAADVRASQDDSENISTLMTERDVDKSGLQIFSFGNGGAWTTEEGWVSGCYGERTMAPVCTFLVEGAGQQEFCSFLIPKLEVDRCSAVHEIEAIGGHAFEIHDDESYDMLLLGNGCVIETNRITTDFKWAWARFALDETTIEELVLLDGRRFSFNNQQILDLPEDVGYVVARRVGDRLSIEFEDRVLEVGLPDSDLVAASLLINPSLKIR